MSIDLQTAVAHWRYRPTPALTLDAQQRWNAIAMQLGGKPGGDVPVSDDTSKVDFRQILYENLYLLALDDCYGNVKTTYKGDLPTHIDIKETYTNLLKQLIDKDRPA